MVFCSDVDKSFFTCELNSAPPMYRVLVPAEVVLYYTTVSKKAAKTFLSMSNMLLARHAR